MQLLRQYYISYDLWDMMGNMHGASTWVMETVLKYYIGAVGRSYTLCQGSSGIQLMVLGDSANVAAATTVPPPPAKRVKETSGHAG